MCVWKTPCYFLFPFHSTHWRARSTWPLAARRAARTASRQACGCWTVCLSTWLKQDPPARPLRQDTLWTSFLFLIIDLIAGDLHWRWPRTARWRAASLSCSAPRGPCPSSRSHPRQVSAHQPRYSRYYNLSYNFYMLLLRNLAHREQLQWRSPFPCCVTLWCHFGWQVLTAAVVAPVVWIASLGVTAYVRPDVTPSPLLLPCVS